MKYLTTVFPYVVIAGGIFIAVRQEASYKGTRIEGEQAIWYGLLFASLGLLMLWRERVRKKKVAQSGIKSDSTLDD